MSKQNKDQLVIDDFSNEWKTFDYRSFSREDLLENFNSYFSIFPWEKISKKSVGFDMGCGTGRWAQFILPKVKGLNCIEPSDSIEVARRNLKDYKNVNFFNETTEDCTLESQSQDFGYCLGVLHHIPNTKSALKDCVRILKKGAPILVYLYYDFDNRPSWFRAIWLFSDILRQFICRRGNKTKLVTTFFIAALIYFPISRLSFFLNLMKINTKNIPLSFYQNLSFYQMWNDALDRFGTKLEKRFTRKEIKKMALDAGLEKIIFSENSPFWCFVGYKKDGVD
jgi:ubiquinone/menaquinone biosynthesis C-methylase UbiE